MLLPNPDYSFIWIKHERGGFLLRYLDLFLQLDVFGFAQYTRRRGVGVTVSSCVPQTAQAEFPNSVCPEFATHTPTGPAA